MDKKIANAVGGYFETLYDINVKIIRLCGMDIMSSHENDERIVLDIIQDIFRIFPYKYDINQKIILLDQNGGLLEFKNDLDYLEKDFFDILKDNYDFLYKIKKIRNKYEHKMHDVKIEGKGTGSFVIFDFDFNVDGKKITVCAGSFIKLICQLNKLYSKIQAEVAAFIEENNKTHSVYYYRVTRFNFNDFKKIYDDNNLRLIGKLMHTF